MKDRRDHDRRIDDIDGKLCKHLEDTKGVVGDVAEMKVDVKEIKELLQNMDVDSLKAMTEIARGGARISNFVIAISKFLGAMAIIAGSMFAFFKLFVK